VIGLCEPAGTDFDSSTIPCILDQPCPNDLVCVPTPGNCHDAVLGVCSNGTICTTANTTLDANGNPICANDSVCTPGPAGSDKDCNDAIKNSCTIFGGCATDSCSL
jgi:hypothetical protein